MAKEIPSIFPCAFWPFVYLRGEKSIQVLGPLVKSGYWPFCCWGFNIFWTLDPYRTRLANISLSVDGPLSVWTVSFGEEESQLAEGTKMGTATQELGKSSVQRGGLNRAGPRASRALLPSLSLCACACVRVCVCRRRARSRCAFRAPRVLPGTVVTVNILRSGTANSGQVLSPFHRSQVK